MEKDTLNTPGEITQLLHQVSKGKKEITPILIEAVYHELKVIARHFFSKEKKDHTWQPTILVHEVLLKLTEKNKIDWNDREHFFAVASKLMRYLLIDHARERKAQKRGGGVQNLPLDKFENFISTNPNFSETRFLELDEALNELEKINPRQAKLVELRFFGGLSLAECSQAMEVSEATLKRDWTLAKFYLEKKLSPENES